MEASYDYCPPVSGEPILLPDLVIRKDPLSANLRRTGGSNRGKLGDIALSANENA